MAAPGRAICVLMAGSLEVLPPPDDPTLAVCAVALNEAGYWATLYDTSWRCVFATDDLRLALADTMVPLGSHFLSAEARRHRRATSPGSAALPVRRTHSPQTLRYMLATMEGGRDGLRRVVDPDLADLVDEVQAEHPPPVWTWRTDFTFAGMDVSSWSTWITLADSNGSVVGYCSLVKPAAGMSELAGAVAMADLSHLERMRLVESPSRKSAAILMADLEASSALARRLSTAQYFAFVRRLVRAADDRFIDGGGIVGRHTGDGFVAFFLAETWGSESGATRSCIVAARALRGVLSDVAERSQIRQSELSLRFGLHWGATLYMGRI